ncbi:MAG: glycogen/starch synthase [Bacteroidales bacterium]|jgi:starch synthase|nr:glycogen/starch synthase [Bacteroidales bacterium]
MGKGRILFVSQEIMPFLPENEISYLGRYLPSYVQEKGREIRVFMPRFSSVNERKNQLHEVIRLSGMNLIVNNADHQLIIKVGSIPTARMQVYFIDNEEYFTRHKGFYDDKGKFCADNDERMLFFGRGTLEAVRKLAWQPHLIHFTGWFSCMIPFYLRRINKENAFFSGTKTVFTLCNDSFKGDFGSEMERKLKADGATAKDLRLFENLDYNTLTKAAITYAHGIVVASPDVDPELLAFARENKKNIVDYNPDKAVFYEQINKLYDTIIGSNINN